jgi:Cu+-exporting ATPase
MYVRLARREEREALAEFGESWREYAARTSGFYRFREVNMTNLQSEKTGQLTLIRPIQFGSGAFVLLLVVYFAVVGLVSGMDFALEQFDQFWYFIVLLAIGFGIQVGLYTYLKNLVGQHGASGKVVAVSGTTSTAAMVSCCAHYLVNILPVLGITGFLTIVAEYQVELFWLGLVFNAMGILYIARQVARAKREHQKC